MSLRSNNPLLDRRQQLPCHFLTVAVEYRILPGLRSTPPGQMAAGRQPGYPILVHRSRLAWRVTSKEITS